MATTLPPTMISGGPLPDANNNGEVDRSSSPPSASGRTKPSRGKSLVGRMLGRGRSSGFGDKKKSTKSFGARRSSTNKVNNMDDNDAALGAPPSLIGMSIGVGGPSQPVGALGSGDPMDAVIPPFGISRDDRVLLGNHITGGGGGGGGGGGEQQHQRGTSGAAAAATPATTLPRETAPPRIHPAQHPLARQSRNPKNAKIYAQNRNGVGGVGKNEQPKQQQSPKDGNNSNNNKSNNNNSNSTDKDEEEKKRLNNQAPRATAPGVQDLKNDHSSHSHSTSSRSSGRRPDPKQQQQPPPQPKQQQQPPPPQSKQQHQHQHQHQHQQQQRQQRSLSPTPPPPSEMAPKRPINPGRGGMMPPSSKSYRIPSSTPSHNGNNGRGHPSSGPVVNRRGSEGSYNLYPKIDFANVDEAPPPPPPPPHRTASAGSGGGRNGKDDDRSPRGGPGGKSYNDHARPSFSRMTSHRDAPPSREDDENNNKNKMRMNGVPEEGEASSSNASPSRVRQEQYPGDGPRRIGGNTGNTNNGSNTRHRQAPPTPRSNRNVDALPSKSPPPSSSSPPSLSYAAKSSSYDDRSLTKSDWEEDLPRKKPPPAATASAASATPVGAISVSPQRNNDNYNRPNPRNNNNPPPSSSASSTSSYQKPPPSSPPPPSSIEHEPSGHSHPLIEVSPGRFEPLRGSKETWDAVRTHQAALVRCRACQCDLRCVADADLVICPECRFLSPVCDDAGRKFVRRDEVGAKNVVGGVGLGVKVEDLNF